MEPQLKYLAVGSAKEFRVLVSYSPDRNLKDQVKSEINDILSSRFSNGSIRYPSTRGLWYVQSESTGLLFFTLVKNGFPETSASAIFSELKSLFITKLKSSSLSPSTPESYSALLSDDLRRLFTRFNSPQSDKISTLNNKILEVRAIANESVYQAINNLASSKDLEEKTIHLEDSSRLFRSDAKRLEKRMWVKKWKLICIISIIIFAVLLYLIIPLFTDSSN